MDDRITRNPGQDGAVVGVGHHAISRVASEHEEEVGGPRLEHLVALVDPDGLVVAAIAVLSDDGDGGSVVGAQLPIEDVGGVPPIVLLDPEADFGLEVVLHWTSHQQHPNSLGVVHSQHVVVRKADWAQVQVGAHVESRLLILDEFGHQRLHLLRVERGERQRLVRRLVSLDVLVDAEATRLAVLAADHFHSLESSESIVQGGVEGVNLYRFEV